jgi:serine/threonine protein kinase/Tol biopolymer transport system component
MIGQTLSHYKIIEKLGAGGMGEVYLAEDAKLDRTVALKFLPPDMATEADVKARFVQEAKAASALKHPNVCPIHDIQEHEGRLYIVMEHVEGATLTDKKGQLSVKKAVDVIAQVAEGLAAAHEKGIIHRDIKADNIMLRDDGIAQIMDFGLAKLRGVSRLTREGSTVGTTAYMSPEAIQGHDSDHRTDIYSLGVVLFELVTGRLPFDAVHETAVMYEIVNVDAPPISAIKPDIDPELDRIVLECLDKDPDERYQSARELAKDLRRHNRSSSGRQRASQVSTIKPVYQQSGIAPAAHQSSAYQSAVHPVAEQPAAHSAAAPTKRSKLPWIVAGISFLAFFMLFASNMGWVNFYINRTAVPARVTRAHILIPEDGQLASLGGGHIAISPDGTMLAYVATDSASSEAFLWVRPIATLTALKLPGTRDAQYPFWSPDSRNIGFFQNGKMMKIAAAGGPALTICDAGSGRLGSWNADNVIVFSPTFRETLMKVAAAGGVPETLTVRDTTQKDLTHRWPWFLPDGQHYLHFARTGSGSGSENDAICLRSLDGTVYKRLVPAASNPAYASGHILYLRESTLMAHPFDLDALEFTGDAFPVAEDVSFNNQFSKGSFTVSQNGVLAYQSGSFLAGSQLLIYGRDGTVLDSIGDPETYFDFSLSPDESHVLADVRDQNTNQYDIWSYHLGRGIKTRLTFAPEDDGAGVWHPDGERFVFGSERAGPASLMTKAANGVGDASPLHVSAGEAFPTSWSPDGKYVVFDYTDSVDSRVNHIWALDVEGDGTPIQLTSSEFDEYTGILSPDGRWLAYVSEESGTEEVFVAPFPSMSSKWQVSVGSGGDRPRWRRDGKELFYFNNEDEIMAVDVDGTGASFRIGKVTK